MWPVLGEVTNDSWLDCCGTTDAPAAASCSHDNKAFFLFLNFLFAIWHVAINLSMPTGLFTWIWSIFSKLKSDLLKVLLFISKFVKWGMLDELVMC